MCAVQSCALFILLLPIYAPAQDWPLSIWGTSDAPAPVGDSFAGLWAGMEHHCALRSNHSSMCWGNNTFHQVSPSPALAPSSNYFTSFGLGELHSCAVVDNGTVLCWGDNTYGQATPPAGLLFRLVVSGRYFSCGLLLSDGSLVCWGSFAPAIPTGDPQFTDLALAVDLVCGVLANGSALCLDPSVPAPSDLTFRRVCAGNAFACGVLTNGSVVCWGAIYQESVAPADDLFTSISCGWYHACGLRQNNTIRCWFSEANTTRAYVSGPNSNPQLAFARVATGYATTAGLVYASPSPSRSPTPSPSPLDLLSNATKPMPELRFVASQPKVVIQPAGVSVAVGRVAEVGANGTELLSSVICPGRWSDVSNGSDAVALGAYQSFVFMTDLAFGANATSSCTGLGSPDTPRMELQFFTFAQSSNISLGSNSSGNSSLSYGISPTFTKFTLRLYHWPWLDNGTNRVEVGIDFSPAFTSFVLLSAAQDVATTFELRGQESGADDLQYTTQVRLLPAVELDDVLVLPTNASDDREAVEFALDVRLSRLVLSFARFNTSLDYDPDIGVLLGRKRDDGGSDDNLAVIVGVAVAVPVAIGLVLVVIAVGAVVLKWQSMRRGGRQAINIDHTDFAEADAAQL